jgi:alpha-1,3-glucosyltransferase
VRLPVSFTFSVLTTCGNRWARTSTKPDYPTAFLIAASVVFHPGLIIVDHIHFQYNGFLLGILLWSLIAARDARLSPVSLCSTLTVSSHLQNNLYLCAALFATLLNFKHIFVYLALPYFVFLLRRHCYPPGDSASFPPSSFLPPFNHPLSLTEFQLDRVLELGLIVGGICLLSFGPFVIAGGPSQLKQIFSRLLPFQRGLNHAYWAGNVWAIVSATDRVLVKCTSLLLPLLLPLSPSNPSSFDSQTSSPVAGPSPPKPSPPPPAV